MDNIEKLGFNTFKSSLTDQADLESFELGRVIAEHKERYIVSTNEGNIEAEITGKMRFTASGREDYPAVGDWVLLTPYRENAIIHEVLPRKTVIKRQTSGQASEIQLIAANVDTAFLMQSVGYDVNINRLERYLSICAASKVNAVIVLSKIDLISENELKENVEKIRKRIPNIEIVCISNVSQSGYEQLNGLLEEAKTYCMLGSSGVGKSTLLNNLSGDEIMKTNHISESTGKGRHVSTHRELRILNNRAILIDNPGMREVGMADSSIGIESTFAKIEDLSSNCKYDDCTHTSEVGCAVIDAVENDELDEAYYQNYIKLQKENAHYESSDLEKRQKDKDFGKMIKTFKKNRKSNKY